MCTTQESHRTYWQRALANFSLVAGLLLWNFMPKSATAAHPWLDAFAGLLMGVSIGMNLLLLVRSRRRRSEPRAL